jgi:hypothetical protein
LTAIKTATNAQSLRRVFSRVVRSSRVERLEADQIPLRHDAEKKAAPPMGTAAPENPASRTAAGVIR